MFLFEQIEQAKNYGAYKELPSFIEANLNPSFDLREYQEAAFQNFITYFETETLKRNPSQTLFHMATGSGKTLIMAGLMLYLYRQGYRNFLFFVNLDIIVKKTKDNFLNPTSRKFLFAEEINLDGERIKVKEVNNFQYSDPSAINICFTTTQGLHSDMWMIKENAMSFDDFTGRKVVLISDEAHHLNADTKRGSKEEDENRRSWEYTISRIFQSNNENILLEFTATCDLDNANIRAEYESKIVFDYPLRKFREDKFSKEIKTLRSDLSIMERALQAIVLSQYRVKVFQDHRLAIKPVVLFKAAKIQDSKDFMEAFITTVSELTGEIIERIAGMTDNDTMKKVFRYFLDNNITFDRLAQELKEEFGAERCISVNDDKEANIKQIIINSLEDSNNPYRAVFEVKKLDEGWDVLNLFDIVRLYETRQSGGKKISPATIAEAQLIGRGARYCPFTLSDEQPKFKRKYDDDLDNSLRICEELYYHCQNDHRYVTELTTALKEIGLDTSNTVERIYKLKDEFKADDVYKQGYVFTNARLLKSRNEVMGLLPSVRDREYIISLYTGKSGEDIVLADKSSSFDVKTHVKRFTFKEIAGINYSIVHRALRRHNVYKFNTLKSYFPNLTSTRQFIMDGNYLGNIKIALETKFEEPSTSIIFEACVYVLGKIGSSISSIEETYEGSKEFRGRYIREVFKDKRSIYSNPHGDGEGVSQNNAVSSTLRIDLSQEDWFAFTDNFGTSEEKAFVAYFKGYVSELKKRYDKVYLVRNERQLALYSFDGGERFEPDYLLFLHKNGTDGYEQLQIFIEPKGSHLLEKDKWKEDFLLQIESVATPVIKFKDDNKYTIWGFHFFNRDNRSAEFAADMQRL